MGKNFGNNFLKPSVHYVYFDAENAISNKKEKSDATITPTDRNRS